MAKLEGGTGGTDDPMTPSLPSPPGQASWSKAVSETVNGSHHYTVKGYSLAKGMGSGKYMSSDTFTVGGYQWAVYFYPDGKNPEDGAAYVSVFVALASEGTDVRALFELTLLDQSGRGRHKVHSHFDRALESGPYTLKYRGSMWGYKRFFRRTALETSDFLKDDCLAMHCTVGVVRTRIEVPKKLSIPVPPSDLGLCLNELLKTGVGSDIAFEVGDESFRAHKLILAARSPVFRAQFFGLIGNPNTDRVVVEDVEPPVFKEGQWVTKKGTWGPHGEFHSDLPVFPHRVHRMAQPDLHRAVPPSIGYPFARMTSISEIHVWIPTGFAQDDLVCQITSGSSGSIGNAMLQYIYSDVFPDVYELTGSLSMCTSTILVQHILAAADRYGLDRLKLLCEEKLCEDISSDMVTATLALAEQHHCARLKSACLKYAAMPGNLGAVMETEGFGNLGESCPSLLSDLLETIAMVDADSGQLCRKRGDSSVIGLDLTDGVDSGGRRMRRRP